MLESDADRLATIVALGGLRMACDTGFLIGIFDNAADTSQFDDGVVVTAGPQAQVRSSDVVRLKLKHGAAITIEGANYRVLRVMPDGTGMTTLLLEDA